MAWGARRWRVLAAAIASYVALGVLANLPAWLDGAARAVQAGGAGDVGQELWFLAWVPAALGHGLDPFVTTYLNAPFGVTLMDNTAMPLAGLIGAPVTLVAGPVAAFDALVSLAFAASATSAFLVLRRFVTSQAAAYLGGLCFGFSPFMVAAGRGHLFLLCTFLLPVLLLLLDELLVRQRRSPVRTGALLGLVALAQLGLSAELLAWAALVGLVGLVVLGALAGRGAGDLGARLRHGAVGLGVAAGVFAVLAAFPLSTLATGPDHNRGSVHPTAGLAGLSADLVSPVVPTANERLGAGLQGVGDRFVTVAPAGSPPQPDPAENGSYVGIPLLVLLGAGAVACRGDRTLRVALVMAGAAFVCSLGSHLAVAGHRTAVPLPFLVLTRLPLLRSGVAARFAVFEWLFLALALARVLDNLVRRRPPPVAARLRRRLGATAAPWAIALGAVALVPLVPAWPYGIARVRVPAFFSSPAEAAVPPGSTLLAYPMARQSHSQAMVWQAFDAFRYKIPAGEAAVADTHYSPLEAMLGSCYTGTRNLPLGPTLDRQVRHDLAVRQVATVVVPGVEPGAACARRYLEAALGRPPRQEAGAAVWSGLRRSTG